MFSARYLLKLSTLATKQRSLINFSVCSNIQNHYNDFNTCLPVTNYAVTQTRHYAKSKDKKKEKGKSKIQINESMIAEFVNVESLKTHMQKSIDVLKEEFIKHLSLRSTTGSIDSLKLHLDGKDHLLQEVAQIVRKSPKMIVVNMAVFPQAIPAAIKAIEKSGMNLSPQQDGTTLFIPVPLVTREHRENLAKNAKTLFIKCRDHIKDEQNMHIKSLKKQEDISIDTAREIEQQIIAITNNYVSEAEKLLETKKIELTGKD